MRKTVLDILAGSSLLVIAAASPAFAQVTPPAQPDPAVAAPATEAPIVASEEEEDEGDIVVTGTSIRGATPGGSIILTTTAKEAEEQGAMNGNDILANTPQAANFFQSLPSVAGLADGAGGQASHAAVTRLPNAQVSLRQLPNPNTGGAPTLIIMDGHRVVPIGTDVLGGQSVDSSLFPSSMILRTEIMPDGGSAIYGTDAVAGVINYITRDEFDGIQVQARAGVARDVWQYDGSITGGTKWGTGSVFATFGYSHLDPLKSADRDYLSAFEDNVSSPIYGQDTSLNCDAANISISGADRDPGAGVDRPRRLYPLAGVGGAILPYTTNFGTNGGPAGLTPAQQNGIAGGNRCSLGLNSYRPKENRYFGAIGLRQELTDTLVFRLKGIYSKRKTQTDNNITLTANNILPSNPNYRRVCNAPVVAPAVQPAGPICGVTPGFHADDANATQSILSNWSNFLGPQTAWLDVDYWQVSPSLAWDFAEDWQVRLSTSYGESRTQGIQASFQTTTATNRINSGLINPYNLALSGPGAFDNLFLYGSLIGEFEMFDGSVIADGPLPFLKLPAGEIRAAIGAQYTNTNFISNNTGAVLSPTPNNFVYNTNAPEPGKPQTYRQTVKSVFGELRVPVFSEDMNIPLFNSLEIAASARYDKYNDFGDTTNPMIGVNWEPVDWIKIRGNWNTSFAAPNNLNQIGVDRGAQANNSNCNGSNTSLCSTTGNVRLPYFELYHAPGDPNGGTLIAGGNPANDLGARDETAGIGIALTLNNGTVPDIGPQTSETWSLGFDVDPPFIPGFSFGASYYDLKISGTIASPARPAVQSIFDTHPELIYCHNPDPNGAPILGSAPNAPAACAIPFSKTELLATGFLTAVPNGFATSASLGQTGVLGSGSNLGWQQVLDNYCEPDAVVAGTCAQGTYTVFYIADNRQRNIGFVYSRGIDFHASYRTNVPWGRLDARISGTRNLETATQADASVAKVKTSRYDVSNFRFSASLGTDIGGFRGQITWQHSAGWKINPNDVGVPGTSERPGSGVQGQTKVGDYNTFDLFFRYDFDEHAGASGMLKDLSVTLNVNNVFDTEPPRRGGSFANGLTLGRQFLLGVTKKFGGN